MSGILAALGGALGVPRRPDPEFDDVRMKVVPYRWRWLLPVLIALLGALPARAAEVLGARLAEAPDRVQLVLDLSGPVRYSSFALDNPPRLVLDLPDTRGSTAVRDVVLQSADIRSVRGGIRDGRDLRVVVDLERPLRAETYFAPAANGGGKLVVEFRRAARRGEAEKAELPGIELVSVPSSEAQPVRRAPQPLARAARRQIVVAIDPGHGGKDTGALGRNGTREKDVVLAIGRKLAALIDAESGMRAVLTRRTDVFLPLRNRIDVARRHKADLFISIHADSAPGGSTATGSTVYMLSTRGASSEAARWLADSENAADLVGGLKLSDKDEQLASVLIDLSQEASLEASQFLAEKVLTQLRRVGDLHRTEVERAGFVVLKAPDIPSILVETAFLSNPQEEAQLADDRHQRALARAVMEGIRQYYRQRLPHGLMVADAGPVASPTPEPPPERPAAARAERVAASVPRAAPAAAPSPRRAPVPAATPVAAPAARPEAYVVRRGESLAEVAVRLGTSLGRLKSANGLPENQLRVPAGTRLLVPRG